MRLFSSKRQNGKCPAIPEVVTLDELVVKARTGYQAAVEKLNTLVTLFQATDFDGVPLDTFQARETEIRQQQLVVEAKRAHLDELEATQAKQLQLENEAFLKQQRISRISEITVELTRLAEDIPAKHILLNKLPFEIETMRQRSMELQRERALLL